MRIVLHFLITKQDLFQIRNRVQLLLAVICGFLPIETELSGGQDRNVILITPICLGSQNPFSRIDFFDNNI